MAAIVGAAVAALAVALVLPTWSDLLSLLRPARGRTGPVTGRSEPRLLVLVPAHDEEATIGDCVASLLAADYPRDRRSVIVIADNCSDRTAEVARGLGAEVLERHDPDRRGKPHALHWALAQVPLGDRDAVVIVDADSVVDRHFFRALTAFEGLRDMAVQANHGVSNPGDTDITWLAAVFGESRYRYAFPLKERAGLAVPLMGNGMCLGAGVLERHGWQAFSICEDWELYAQYTTWRVPIHVAPDAYLYAQEARTLAQSTSQRERWTAGKLEVLLRYAPGLLRAPGLRTHQRLDALGELLAPGPVVHLGLVLAVQLVLLAVPVPFEGLLAALLWAGVLRHGVYAGLAAGRLGGAGRLARALLALPKYLVWRMRVQFTSLRMVRSDTWVKTGRNEP